MQNFNSMQNNEIFATNPNAPLIKVEQQGFVLFAYDYELIK